MPDRGELTAYDKSRRPRISGAYRAYPVRLSEEHALKAAHVGGWMIVNAPDGEKIELAYERHIEHPDGNWTWIGRDAKGAEAVITFGAAATFGTFPETGGDTLRLTMAGGYAWLVVTDRTKIADINRAVTRAGKKDYLIPPKKASAATSDKASIAATAQAAPIAAAAVAQTTVDVVVGYTTGLASALGGPSQAVTRIHNLVDITNQAYANSAVNTTLRLVATVSVNYRDDNDNGDALEALTGSGSTTPDPAFAGLRAARETYGADLVTLLRDFRTPENGGCGIAWLIGGGESGIGQSDAPYGYSVVGDGSDTDGNDTYFCREESFAHELGHNMGQAHNDDDSSTSGAHAYSYGYRESTNNGFYTVMAYSLAGSDQFPIRHFANPAIRFDGRVTGVANASDNARSMNLTAPIIATFRTPVVFTGESVHHDVNADDKSDLLWTRAVTGQFAHWLMNGAKISSSTTYAVGSEFDALGAGDIDGNGYADIVWRNRNTGQLYAWLRTATRYTSRFISTKAVSWRLVGVRDVNGDGRSDLLWSNPGAGQFEHWLMSGTAIAAAHTFAISAEYDAPGAGDVNGDGKADIVWRNRYTGQVYVWLRTTNSYTSRLVTTLGSGWTLAGAGDINNDGKEDLLWSNPGGSQFRHWLMNGATLAGSATYGVGAAYEAVGTGDLDGNGYTDIVWMNRNNGQVYAWIRSPTSYASRFITTPVGWKLIR